GHAEAREPMVHLDREALAAGVVADVQGAEGAAAGKGVAHEAHQPALVWLSRGREPDAGTSHELAALPATDGELFLAIDAVHAFVVAVPASTLEQDVQPAVAPPR